MAFSIPSTSLPFSLPAFLQGLVGALAVLLLLIGWMTLRADDTKLRLQQDMPSKAVIIEKMATEQPLEQKTYTPSPETQAHETHDMAQHTAGENAAPTPLNPALTENINGRIVPRADIQSGITPFKFYRRPASLTPGQAGLGIIFMDIGLAKTLMEKANETLPADITFSFSPYAESIASQAESLRASEREYWLQLPLQNETYPNPDPGPATILFNASIEQNTMRMLDILSTVQGYTGLISYPDHAYYDADPQTASILPQIFGRGLAYIEGRPDKPFFGAPLAHENLYPFGQVNVLIKKTDTPEMIERKFIRAENAATQTGRALLMAPLTPLTFAMVNDWTKTFADKAIELAPASALINNNE